MVLHLGLRGQVAHGHAERGHRIGIAARPIDRRGEIRRRHLARHALRDGEGEVDIRPVEGRAHRRWISGAQRIDAIHHGACKGRAFQILTAGICFCARRTGNGQTADRRRGVMARELRPPSRITDAEVASIAENSIHSSSHELFDGAGLREFLPRHFQIEITVVLDGVAVRVEQRGIPVAERLVAFGAVEWQADVAA